MPSVAGFWSYAHADNEHDEGRIRALARRLEAEYELLTAEKLELFIDQTTLEWGDDWRERIAAALERVTFFIPVITPTYFRRPECRKELLRFAKEAKKQRAEKLILPIYYVEVPELESDETPADEAMAAVKPFQREDLRHLRLEDQNGAEYRRLVSGLAHRLISIAREAEESDGGIGRAGSAPAPSPPAPPASPPAESTPALEDDEPDAFYLEKMARGEEALGEINGPLEAIGADIKALGSLSEEATREMAEADQAGKPGFASRLAIARQLASRLEEPARSLEAHAQEYVSRLWEVDPFVNKLLDWALERDGDDPDEEENKEEFVEAVLGLAQATSGTSESTSDLVKSIEQNANFSRDLRQPLRTYQTSLRNILDAQAVIDLWARRAEGAEKVAPDSPPEASASDAEQADS